MVFEIYFAFLYTVFHSNLAFFLLVICDVSLHDTFKKNVLQDSAVLYASSNIKQKMKRRKVY